MINADKPHLWKADIAASVDLYNSWFMQFAPATYRKERVSATQHVKTALGHANDLLITPETLEQHPDILPTLRMSTAPPIARDRLIGLAHASANLIGTMEEKKSLPPRMAPAVLREHLDRICAILAKLLDQDIFPWLAEGRKPSARERNRASTIVADRLCGSSADPIIRNAQERRQLALIEEFLTTRGYRKKSHPTGEPVTEMEPGTFCFRMNLAVRERKVNIPVDVVIQPRRPRVHKLPILIEAKSAGDFTNPNKRRKEEATKISQLRGTYGPEVEYILFLCGYFDGAYLGYEAAEGLDWVWEHRIEDLLRLGIDA